MPLRGVAAERGADISSSLTGNSSNTARSRRARARERYRESLNASVASVDDLPEKQGDTPRLRHHEHRRILRNYSPSANECDAAPTLRPRFESESPQLPL
ncbi:hypothetical protein EYF80_027564 [Liparis tanakae]|uniref:Uncharacterized protein n=1 Tax=Liparis tanakae TaxID=230148 RepID=A0A4Z2HBC4_9TELE|nr:hypothetical protein EYF80_027564 [Liparis tanakae]